MQHDKADDLVFIKSHQKVSVAYNIVKGVVVKHTDTSAQLTDQTVWKNSMPL